MRLVAGGDALPSSNGAPNRFSLPNITHPSVIKTTFLLYFATPAGMTTACDAMDAVSIIGLLEAIRLMAVERVRGGELPSSVIASFGFNRTTIYRWLEVASKPGMGLSALRSRPATGRPRSLTSRQEQQVFRWIQRL